MSLDELVLHARDRVFDQAAACPPQELSELVRRGERRRRRRTVAGLALAVAVLALTGAILASARPEKTPPASLSTNVRHVVRADLGFAVDIPAAWTDQSTTSTCQGGGWVYCALQDNPRQGLLGFHLSLIEPVTADHIIEFRSDFLKSSGATIKSSRKTRIDGHDAAEIHYVLPARVPGGRAVEDIEYDIVTQVPASTTRVGLILGLIVVQNDPMPDRSLPD